MKKLLFLVFVISCTCVGVTMCIACSQESAENREQEKTETYDLMRTYAKQVINGNSESVDSLINLVYNEPQATRSTSYGSFTIDTISLNQYLMDNSLEFDDLDVFFEKNPEETDIFVRMVCSSVFYKYYEEASRLYTSSIENEFYNSVYFSQELSHSEKIFLFLIASSENQTNIHTRSISSCIKRYIKLTTISIKTFKLEFIDMQSAVEYATRELKSMGHEYDC